MCGRYSLAQNLTEIIAAFGAQPSDVDSTDAPLWDWEPNYNIAPASVVPVLAFDGQKQRKVVPMRWGLHPHWKKGPPEGRPLFNARSETAAEKPSFRTPYRRRRALIPATGWYEWEGVEKPKTPYYIRQGSEEIDKEAPLAFAGLWDKWRVSEGIELLSCTILTTPANGEMKHLHHRMPVRLPCEKWDSWLDWEVNSDFTLSQKLGGEDLHFHEVGREVSSGRASGAGLIIPAVFQS
ncbi:MAG: SOS response-associated peptidase [Litorimonas sp.]